jgi:molecular chaperone DnaJ
MDFYVILGVESGTPVRDIRRAYRRLARKHHPDLNPGDRMAALQFRQIAEAYETLSDPERRRRYDAVGHSTPAEEEATFGFQGFDFSASESGAPASTFGDLFADVLYQREARRQEGALPRGADLHQTIALSFEDAMRGGRPQVTITRQERCGTCRGAGRLHASETRCAPCHGSGAMKSVRGHMVFSKPCPRCDGTGRQRQDQCPACAGRMVEMRTEPLTITVPPGLPDGTRIRVAGKGHAGPSGGEHGDLYITVHVQAHPSFRREGDDLHIVVPIAVHEAALGAKIEVASLDGPARLRVPPGTQSGQRFRLRDRGVPSLRDNRRGDLVVEVRLVLPKLLDERSKELLREFGRINSEDARRVQGG